MVASKRRDPVVEMIQLCHITKEYYRNPKYCKTRSEMNISSVKFYTNTKSKIQKINYDDVVHYIYHSYNVTDKFSLNWNC